MMSYPSVTEMNVTSTSYAANDELRPTSDVVYSVYSTKAFNGTTPYPDFDLNHLVDGYKPLHWVRLYNENPPSVTAHTVLGVYSVIIGIVGSIANLLIIWLITTTRSLRTPSNLLIVNLALSDFLMISNNATLYAVSSFYNKWIFGQIGCNVYAWFGGMFGLLSINTLAVIAVDRYYVIKNSEKLKKLSYKQVVIGLAIIWIWCFAWTLPPWIGPVSYVAEGFLTTCTIDYVTQTIPARYFLLGMFLCCFILPLTAIILCYSLILRMVRRHERTMTKTVKGLNATLSKNERSRSQEVKVAKISVKLVFGFLYAWSPYAVVAMIGFAGKVHIISPLASQVLSIFCKNAAVYNPILYAMSHPKYRQTLMNRMPMMKMLCKETRQQSDSGDSGSTLATESEHSIRRTNAIPQKSRLGKKPAEVHPNKLPVDVIKNPNAVNVSDTDKGEADLEQRNDACVPEEHLEMIGKQQNMIPFASGESTPSSHSDDDLPGGGNSNRQGTTTTPVSPGANSVHSCNEFNNKRLSVTGTVNCGSSKEYTNISFSQEETPNRSLKKDPHSFQSSDSIGSGREQSEGSEIIETKL